VTLALLLEALVKVFVLLVVLLPGVACMSWVERRLGGRLRGRRGPGAVGPAGLPQPLADGIEFPARDEPIPANAYGPLYLLAPAITLMVALSTFAVIPFGSSLELWNRRIPLRIADVNIGILFFLAVGSINVYGLMLGGWASGSKHSLMGGMRLAARAVSYELALGASIVGVLMAAGSLRLSEVVAAQGGGLLHWNLITQPLAALVFLVAAFAATNRLPFDLPESHPELVGGRHAQYSRTKSAVFFMGEYAHMFTMSALMTILFLGGWHLPLLDPEALGWSVNLTGFVHIVSFVLKVGLLMLLFVWIRWTLPRLRHDQLMSLGWKVLLPLTLVNIVYVGLGIAWGLPWLGRFAG